MAGEVGAAGRRVAARLIGYWKVMAYIGRAVGLSAAALYTPARQVSDLAKSWGNKHTSGSVNIVGSQGSLSPPNSRLPYLSAYDPKESASEEPPSKDSDRYG